MAINTIVLCDLDDHSRKRSYPYSEDHTIDDLKRTIVSKEGYRSLESVKILAANFPVPDDVLVKDIAVGQLQEQNALYAEFPNYGSVSVTADKAIYVWAGKNNCFKLLPNARESIQIRHNGNLGVTRNRWVFLQLFSI